MENYEIMNEGIEAMVEDIVVDEVVNKGIGMNKYAKFGLGTAAVAAVAVLIKKGYDMYKSKKELRQPEKEIVVEAEDVEAVVTEE